MSRRLFIFIILGFLLLLAVFYLLKCQSRPKVNPEIEAKNEVIEAIKETVKVYEKSNEDLKLIIKQGFITDSILLSTLQRNQVKYVQYNDQLKNIPSRIAAIANNDDSIRARFDRHQ